MPTQVLSGRPREETVTGRLRRRIFCQCVPEPVPGQVCCSFGSLCPPRGAPNAAVVAVVQVGP
eukprot:3309857-Pyramimonas_sp.AAC.1